MCASLSHIHASLCLFYVAMGLRRRNRRNRRNLKSEGLMSLARHFPEKPPNSGLERPEI